MNQTEIQLLSLNSCEGALYANKAGLTIVGSCGICATTQHYWQTTALTQTGNCFRLGSRWSTKAVSTETVSDMAKWPQQENENVKVYFSKSSLDVCFVRPQLALRLSTCRPLAPAGTGVLSWLSWSHQTVAVTICVRPTTAAAQTLTSSASGQVLDHPFLPLCLVLLS